MPLKAVLSSVPVVVNYRLMHSSHDILHDTSIVQKLMVFVLYNTVWLEGF